jgi:tRNA(Ile)-lysidine synthase
VSLTLPAPDAATPGAAVAACLDDLCGAGVARVGLAVSGGGDSAALLHLAADATAARLRGQAPALSVVTVDHGLRAGSAAEAAAVGAAARALGLPHDTLHWEGWQGHGNLQAAARSARRTLIARWARERGVGAVLLAHTADDVAETFLMRLGRRAGVDGLSPMSARWEEGGILWVRPLLGARRAALRDWLATRGIGWAEDPSNEDAGFARVRARRALGCLAPLGIGTEEIAAAAAALASARAALEHHARAALAGVAAVDGGDLLIDRAGFARLPAETRRRILVHAIGWIAGPGHPPRQHALDRFEAALHDGRAATLAGVRLDPARPGRVATDRARIGREARAVTDLAVAPGAVFDHRWILGAQEALPGGEVRALGRAGLAQCPDRRAAGLPRATLAASPALWQGDRLIAAPLAGLGGGLRLLADGARFFETLLAD